MSGIKDDSEKPRYDLVDPYAVEQLAKVLTFGAKKYAPNNWRKGIMVSRLTGALLRHVFAFMRGDSIDPETGLSHIAHAMCNCMFILWTVENKMNMDDREIADGALIVSAEAEKRYYEALYPAKFFAGTPFQNAVNTAANSTAIGTPISKPAPCVASLNISNWNKPVL